MLFRSTFQGEGYARFCARYGIEADPARFPEAVRAASSILNEEQDHVYDADIFVRYTRCIIEAMGGSGPRVEACAREVYDEWAACQHFILYDDVTPALKSLSARGIKVGLISNSHRSLASFQQHFELHGLITGAISSSEHGFMKPHPSIFEAALTVLGVSARESVMVGDSLAHDIEGARRIGMRGVLLRRSSHISAPAPPGIRVIHSLEDLSSVI